MTQSTVWRTLEPWLAAFAAYAQAFRGDPTDMGRAAQEHACDVLLSVRHAKTRILFLLTVVCSGCASIRRLCREIQRLRESIQPLD